MYSLDTNLIITILNERSAVAQHRFATALANRESLFISSVVLLELWFGVEHSANVVRNKNRLETFLSGPLTVISFDEEDAKTAGALRAGLMRRGTPIGSHDLQIATQALTRNLTVITNNVREFSRVEGLAIEDWLVPAP